ncbi:MAG: tetratricopeptide repeat protein [Desulfuromonadaceae bacterium]|nr:tetratricopeptide repeat protein [Desulfuromonadaceae bacterium]MDD5106552.1 tetratricopeptide repeat protein [Desulfuromonadaceae bacterium]
MKRLRFSCALLATVAVSLCGTISPADAVQWQALSGTVRYKVAYDEQSVRLAPSGRLEVWLRFTPRGMAERKLAVAEYKDKRYRSHREFYEIDCNEQTAILGLMDFFDSSGGRFKRVPGGGQLDPIVPESLLDNVAERICQVLGGDAEEGDDTAEDQTARELETPDNAVIYGDKLPLLEQLLNKVNSKEATFETWKELGNIYFDTDQPELAINAYQRVLALHPDDVDALNDQGAMYRQVGDFDKALANFDKAFSLDPQNLESLYNSGYVYAFDLNNIPKALVMWRRFLELDAKSDTAAQVRSFMDQYGKQPPTAR